MKSSLPILLLLTATASAEPRKLTLASAIELTMQKSPDLAQAQASVDAVKAKTEQSSRKMLPSLNVSAVGNYYTEPYVLAFGSLGNFTLHKQATSFTNVQLLQPLTGLAYLSELVGAGDHEEKAAAADYDRARLDAAYATATAYVKVLEARASADVAHRAVADIQSELEQAQKQRAADTATTTVQDLDAMVPEVQTSLIPWLAGQLHVTPLALTRTLDAKYPKVVRGLRDWPRIRDGAAALAAAQEASVADLQRLDGTPFRALTWFVVVPGFVLTLLAGLALRGTAPSTRRRPAAAVAGGR